MTQLFKTAKGMFTIEQCSWGWGVLNLTTGHVDRCETESECHELLGSHGPADADQHFPVHGVVPVDDDEAFVDDFDELFEEFDMNDPELD